MKPEFMEVHVAYDWKCAHCYRTLRFDKGILHHEWYGYPEESCPQSGMSFKAPIQRFPVYRHTDEDREQAC